MADDDFDPAAELRSRRIQGDAPETESGATEWRLVRVGRKRRKDAKWPADVTDRHHGSQAVTVRLPDALALKVREAAAAEGKSVNAWLLELISNRFL